jgi:CO/xanthine dehydrogenase FAD-binding subunit
MSLIPMMKFRLARPGYLIDINRISGFPTSGKRTAI